MQSPDGRRTEAKRARERQKTTTYSKSLQLHFPSIGAFAAASCRSIGPLADLPDHLLQTWDGLCGWEGEI